MNHCLSTSGVNIHFHIQENRRDNSVFSEWKAFGKVESAMVIQNSCLEYLMTFSSHVCSKNPLPLKG